MANDCRVLFMSTTKRIATVKATGKKYLVQQVSFGTPAKVHVWGEVIRSKGLGTTHETPKAFLLDAVEIAEVPWTHALVAELFKQGCDAKREAGHVLTVSRSGRTVTDHGTPAAIRAAEKARDELLSSLESDPLLAGLAARLRGVR